MVKETTSKTKHNRAELQISRQRRDVEQPWVCAAVSPSHRAVVPVSQPRRCSENPPMPNASAAELLKRNLWRPGESWSLRHKPLKLRGFILRFTTRKAQIHSRTVRGRERRAQGRRAGICFQSTCVSGSGIRSTWVIKRWLNMRWKLPVWFWITISGTELCMACMRAASRRGGVAPRA